MCFIPHPLSLSLSCLSSHYIYPSISILFPLSRICAKHLSPPPPFEYYEHLEQFHCNYCRCSFNCNISRSECAQLHLHYHSINVVSFAHLQNVIQIITVIFHFTPHFTPFPRAHHIMTYSIQIVYTKPILHSFNAVLDVCLR